MTFSIVARDPVTGALGVATATGGPAVGALVPHARAGTGAIATQGYTNALYGFDGLDALASGAPAQAVLEQMTGADAGRERRQLLIVDAAGRTACWTGNDCEAYAATIGGQDVAVGGNMLAGSSVLDAVIKGFESEGLLEERLLAALAAGEAAGGDKRGTRSAALKVYTTEPYAAVDLRCDWSAHPVAELSQILAEVRAPGYSEFFARIPTRAEPER